jgi:hypothetical protein
MSMQRSYRRQSISHQSFAAGFLLANGNQRCSEASVHLRSMPMILLQDGGPNSASVVNSAIMASAEMGHRHCRKADSRARQLYLHGNRSGVFHKMDRGKVAHKCELHNNQKVLLAEHSLLIRGTQTYNSGQRKILRQRNVQRILSVDWLEGCLRISVSPIVEQSSRESKRFDLSGNEKNIGGREER